MNGALETLVAQAYGADQFKVCGAYLNLAYAVTSITFVIGGTILWLIIPLTAQFGQEKEVIENALEFVKYYLPGCYFFALYDLNRRFLICFKITIVPMIMIVGISLLHILNCYLFVDLWGSTLSGLGMASSATCLILALASRLCVSMHQETRVALVWPDL